VGITKNKRCWFIGRYEEGNTYSKYIAGFDRGIAVCWRDMGAM
jgi:hypothetical protein